jgi:hypothetical protein
MSCSLGMYAGKSLVLGIFDYFEILINLKNKLNSSKSLQYYTGRFYILMESFHIIEVIMNQWNVLWMPLNYIE